METSTMIVLVRLAVISIVIILSVVHISSKVDEIANYTRRLMEIAEKNNKDK